MSANATYELGGRERCMSRLSIPAALAPKPSDPVLKDKTSGLSSPRWDTTTSTPLSNLSFLPTQILLLDYYNID